MIVALVVLAAFLYFPALRRGVGAFMTGVLFLVALTVAFGQVGALIALAVGCIAFVRGFARR